MICRQESHGGPLPGSGRCPATLVWRTSNRVDDMEEEKSAMNKQGLQRRNFLRMAAYAGMAGSVMKLDAAQKNIRWALGLVTWGGKAEWPQILEDVEAGGFDGV